MPKTGQTSDCESVMAAVTWAEHYRRHSPVHSGYALDRRIERKEPTPRKDGGYRTSGNFARYASGHCVPSIHRLMHMDASADMDYLLYLSLWRVLRHPPEEDTLWDQLWELDHRLSCRLFSPSVPGEESRGRRSLTARTLLDLAVQGDEHALTALLLLLREECADHAFSAGFDDAESRAYARDHAQLAWLAAQRACQCLVFLLCGPTFTPARTVLVARVRQQYLDGVEFEGRRLALTHYDFIGLAEQVRKELPKQLALAHPASTLPLGRAEEYDPVDRRRALRRLLRGDWGGAWRDQMTVPIQEPDGTITDALQRQPYAPRKIRLEVAPFTRGKPKDRLPSFCTRAVDILKRDLGAHWVD